MLSKLARSPLTHLVLAICFITSTPEAGLAWGSSGHRLIAMLASRKLNPRAEEIVRRMLEKEGMVSVSTWADEIKIFRPETTRWHLVEFPLNATTYIPSRDCIETSQGDCIVAAIQRSIRVLRNDKFDPEDQIEALKFLIHLIGDLHQPLHCGYKDDRGGSTIRVYFPDLRSITNLHSAWDSSMIERAMTGHGKYEIKYEGYLNGNYYEFAKEVERQIRTDESPEEWISDWSFESYCSAVRSAYNLYLKPVEGVCQAAGDVRKKKPVGRVRMTHHANLSELQKSQYSPAVDISGKYYTTNVPAMEKQLVKAGIRLATVLNAIYPARR